MSIIKAQNKANEILKQLKINKAPVNIEKVAKKLKLSIIPYNFGTNVSGALFIKDQIATIGINPLEHSTRKRFTVAHELGHYVLHYDNDCSKEHIFIDKKKFFGFQVHFRDENSTTGELRKEREANAFAAAILMPEPFIKKELETIVEDTPEMTDEDIVNSLAKKFEVSSIAMSHRLTNLNLFRP